MARAEAGRVTAASDRRPDGTDDLAAGLERLAARIDSAEDAVVLVAEDLLLHDEALADLAQDPRRSSAALVSRTASASDLRAGADPAVRLGGGRVVAASSGVHRVADGDAGFAGALR
ncbi:MAG: hypothetical protein ACRDWY_08980, partial [Actinomycetes bacterium]